MSRVKVHYVRNPERKRDVTIVSTATENNGKFVIDFGWCFRSNHDKFIKREGRMLADNRRENAAAGFSGSIEVNALEFRPIISKIIEYIAVQPNTPKKFLEDLLYEWEYYVPRHNKQPGIYYKPQFHPTIDSWKEYLGHYE